LDRDDLPELRVERDDDDDVVPVSPKFCIPV
jgi:hypothetical protein